MCFQIKHPLQNSAVLSQPPTGHNIDPATTVRMQRAPSILLAKGQTRRRRGFADRPGTSHAVWQRRRQGWQASVRSDAGAEATAARRAERILDLAPTVAAQGGRYRLRAALSVSSEWLEKHLDSLLALDVSTPTIDASGQSAFRLLTARVRGADGVISDEQGEVLMSLRAPSPNPTLIP